jgi:hypothetical protein
MALEQRLLTAASLLEDTPLDLSVLGGLYHPTNYDERFRGLVTVRTALAASLNIPAVRTLELVGAEAFVQQLRRLGFEGVSEAGEYYGPSLALGSVDVSLWELVNAYRALANGGVWSPLHLMASEPEAKPARRVFSEQTAFLLSHILSDRDSRSVTFGLENPLATHFWSAVKTGTSKEMRDNYGSSAGQNPKPLCNASPKAFPVSSAGVGDGHRARSGYPSRTAAPDLRGRCRESLPALGAGWTRPRLCRETAPLGAVSGATHHGAHGSGPARSG